MFPHLGRLSYRYRKAIVVVYLLLLPVMAALGAPVFRMLRIGGFEDYTKESWQVRRELLRDLQVGTADIVALYKNDSGNVDDIEMLTAIVDMIDKVEKDPSVARVLSYYTTGADTMVSRDRTQTFVLITVRGDDQGQIEVMERLRPLLDLKGYHVTLGGVAPVNDALYHLVERDLQRAELMAFPLIAIVLLGIFGSVASSSLPLIIGLFAIAFAMTGLRLLLVFTDVALFAANVVSVLGLGLAVDYSLFLVSRFREELRKTPADVEGAVVRSVSTTGRAVAFSGVTVAASLCGLFAFPQMFLRSMAMGGMLVAVGCLVLSLTLLPALLSLFGARIDAGRVPFLHRSTNDGASLATDPGAGDDERTFWWRVARVVMRRPLVVLVVVAVPLCVLGAPFFRSHLAIGDHRLLPKGTPARETMEIIDRDFLPFLASPHEVVVELPAGVDGMSERGLELLADAHAKLRAVPNIRRVDGVMSGIDVLGREAWIDKLRHRDQALQALVDLAVRGNKAHFALLSTVRFNTVEAEAQVHALRALDDDPALRAAGVRVRVGGLPAILYDLLEAIRERAPIMVGMVGLVMFVVLFLVFGSVTIPLKAMVMNSLSLTASFGAMVFIFEDGRLTGLLDYEPLHYSDATTPLLVFAVVFGLSMDYEVLLLARVREEFVRTGDNARAVAAGLARTGRLITSAALLLVVVIGAFGASDILFMKTIGLGMALAIAIDATVIRALLVPATMQLMGRWNWWAPRPMLALWRRIGLSDDPH